MASIVVSLEDVQLADTFLSTYAQDKVPEADFNEGSVTRDFVIKAIAYIFAFLRKEQQSTRDRQSLLTLANLPADESVDDAVDALLSNWFLTRKTGRQTHLAVLLHFSRSADVTILPSTRFFKTATLAFTIDSTSSIVIPASELRATVNSDGSIQDYTAIVMMIANAAGTDYNVTAGRFVSSDQFNPYFTYAENQSAGYDGLDIESTADLLIRAPTAITVRNLINTRSIDTVLREAYTGLSKVVSIGYGDPEMIRDRAQETAMRLDMHTGGCNDIYLSLNRTDTVETDLLIGGQYKRPDGIINLFKDATIDFLAGGVELNDVLRIDAGIPNVPSEYIITDVRQHELSVRERYPFGVATDEASPPTFVTYTIGRLAPDFMDVVGPVPITTGSTSRLYQRDNCVMLTACPHYRIKQVQVVFPTSTVDLTSRVNTTPNPGEYHVIGLLPGNAHSAWAMDLIEVHSSYAGYTLNVTYETLVDYAAIQAFVTDRRERVICANPLARGLHPVYVELYLTFRDANTATTPTDLVALQQSISDYINTFDIDNTLDLSNVLRQIRANFPTVGTIYDPTTLLYRLYAPNGQAYEYKTRDLVTIHPAYPGNRAYLSNGLLLETPIVNADIDPTLNSVSATLFAAANASLNEQYRLLGISDRTTRYMTQPELITVNRLE